MAIYSPVIYALNRRNAGPLIDDLLCELSCQAQAAKVSLGPVSLASAFIKC
jgi:hypothetical protein